MQLYSANKTSKFVFGAFEFEKVFDFLVIRKLRITKSRIVLAFSIYKKLVGKYN